MRCDRAHFAARLDIAHIDICALKRNICTADNVTRSGVRANGPTICAQRDGVWRLNKVEENVARAGQRDLISDGIAQSDARPFDIESVGGVQITSSDRAPSGEVQEIGAGRCDKRKIAAGINDELAAFRGQFPKGHIAGRCKVDCTADTDRAVAVNIADGREQREILADCSADKRYRASGDRGAAAADGVEHAGRASRADRYITRGVHHAKARIAIACHRAHRALRDDIADVDVQRLKRDIAAACDIARAAIGADEARACIKFDGARRIQTVEENIARACEGNLLGRNTVHRDGRACDFDRVLGKDAADADVIAFDADVA